MELVDEQSMQALAPPIKHVMKSFSTTEEIVIPQGFSTYMETFRLLQGKEIWQTHGEWIQKESVWRRYRKPLSMGEHSYLIKYELYRRKAS